MKTIAKIIGGIFIVLFAVILFFAERDRPVEELIPLYTNKDSKFMDILGMKVHYRDEGVATDSVPLILLHGMSSSLNTWDSVGGAPVFEDLIVSVCMNQALFTVEDEAVTLIPVCVLKVLVSRMASI